MRKAFNFYASYDDTLQELSTIQYVQFMKALLDVQFLRKHIDKITFKDKMVGLLWKANKHSIKKQLEGYCVAKKIAYNSLFIDVLSTPPKGTKGGTKVQEQGQVKGQEKEEGEGGLNASLRFATLSLISTKDNNTHKPREVYQLLQQDKRFSDKEVLELATKFVKYRDEMYSATKDKKYAIRTTRAIIGFMNELSETNDYDKAFGLMEDNEWATFKREWVKGEV